MTALRHRPLELKLRHPFRLSRGTWDVRHNVLVEVEQDGQTGMGEAAPIPRYGETHESAARAIEEMAGRLADPTAFSDAASRAAVAGQRSAEAAVDMALHDLAGRRLGAPLFALLGLDPARMPVTSFTIAIDTPEGAASKARAASQYAVLKLKMGSEADREMVAAVREATDRPIRVDANEGWTFETAVERLEWLAGLGVEFVEQPLPAAALEETRALRRRSPLPFYADESVHTARDIPSLVGAFDGINIKLMKCGGIAEALRMIAVARAHGLKVMLGCMIESSLGVTAAAHLAPLADAADLDGNLLVDNDPFVGVRVKDGRLVLPEGPGLGVSRRA
ncbi:MAG TPA: dipeptide epimerase [Vicinamibacteria bacterium]|nr:dipeptide epimerase [Vicinamibacteria bacterium]